MKILLDTSVLVAAIVEAHPIQRRISPALAVRLIEQDVFATCQVISLSEAEYRAVVEHLSERNIVGGATYDALFVHAAAKADADVIVTLNERDFGRIYPDFTERIVTP